jgi:cellulose synthase/poly-beta-1,6-N-acetylglucosamine synthase-like glycosyltransferase
MIPLVALGVFLCAYVLYQTLLFVVNAVVPDPPVYEPAVVRRFNIVIPAHNEELHLPRLLRSATTQEYPTDRFAVTVIADNCTDGTVAACAGHAVTVLERHDPRMGARTHAAGPVRRDRHRRWRQHHPR